MSLSSILKKEDPRGQEILSALKPILPQKDDFTTLSGKAPFSNSDYLVSKFDDTNASIIGTAFDYLARALIAKKVERNQKNAFLCLVSTKTVSSFPSTEKYQRIREQYVDHLSLFIEYISSGFSSKVSPDDCNHEEWEAINKYIDRCLKRDYEHIHDFQEIIPCTLFFAKIEQFYRSGSPKVLENIFDPPNKREIEELTALGNIFCKFFLSNIVSADSIVEYNPSFGSASKACAGADADVYIDGTIYDFKSGQNTKYVQKEVAQLVMYYFLNQMEKGVRRKRDSLPAQLINYNISNLAIYRVRTGEIETVTTEKLNNQDAITAYKKIRAILGFAK